MRFTVNNSGFAYDVEIPDVQVRRIHRPLVARFHQAAAGGRAVIMVAGPPASGKTMLCAVWQQIADAERLSFVTLAMDGFHFPNAYLAERDLAKRKGSPETFDVRSMTIALAQINAGTPTVWPLYDRNLHEPVAEGVGIDEQKVVVIEGNYFLLDEPHWASLRRYATLTVRLDVDRDCLRERIVERHVRGGMSRQKAEDKFRESDLHNIVLVKERSVEADIVLLQDAKGSFRLLAGGGRSL